MVRTLHTRNYSVAVIAETTGLPPKQIRQIISDESPSVYPEKFKKP